jgi:phospholipid/cholesterol/gamma-HCH transport system substrate-binding protein
VFVVVGLALMAGLIIRFGQYRPGQKAGYEIRVMFPNAAGLIKDAGVMYAGIRVGKVSGIELTEQRERPVRVRLSIDEGVVIRQDAKFVVNQAGLLGDRYVDVAPGSSSAKPLRAGDTVDGSTSADLNEAVNKVKAALDQAGETIAKLDHALQQLNTTVLSTQSLQHAQHILGNVDAASSNAVALVQDLKQVVSENSAQLNQTLKEFHETSVNLRSASKRTDD